MWWRSFFLHFCVCSCVLLSLQSCGFKPVHGSTTLSNGAGEHQTNRSQHLASIQVAPIAGRLGQKLRTRLKELLNPKALMSQQRYKLVIGLNKQATAIGIQQDREITRFNLLIQANYQLYSIGDNKLVQQGTVKRVGSYDAVDSQYATFIAEEDTSFRVVQELAQDIRTRLSVSFPSK